MPRNSRLQAVIAKNAEAKATQQATEVDLQALANLIAPQLIPHVLEALANGLDAPLTGTQEHLTGVIKQAVGSIPRPIDRTGDIVDAMSRISLPETDLTPVLDAIKGLTFPEGKEVDLSGVMAAIKRIKPGSDRPRKWRLVHHTDKRGNIIETEAIAED